MPKPDPVPVRYDLGGGFLFAAQLVGAAPEATSFAFFLINEGTGNFTASTPPVRGGDNEIGRPYRVPGPMSVPLPVSDVLRLLDGCILESSVTIVAGEGGEPSATLVLFQHDGADLHRLGEATVVCETVGGNVQDCRPRIRLIGSEGV